MTIISKKWLILYVLLLSLAICSLKLTSIGPIVFTILYILPNLIVLDYVNFTNSLPLSKIFADSVIYLIILSIVAFSAHNSDQNLLLILKSLWVKSFLIALNFLISICAGINLKLRNPRLNNFFYIQVYIIFLYSIFMIIALIILSENRAILNFIYMITMLMIINSLNVIYYLIFNKYLLNNLKLQYSPSVLIMIGMIVSILPIFMIEINSIYIKQIFLLYETILVVIIAVNISSTLIANHGKINDSLYLKYIFSLAFFALLFNLILENIILSQRLKADFSLFTITGGEIWCLLFCFIIKITKLESRLHWISLLLSILVIFASTSRKLLYFGFNKFSNNEFYVYYFSSSYLISTIAMLLLVLIAIWQIGKALLLKNSNISKSLIHK